MPSLWDLTYLELSVYTVCYWMPEPLPFHCTCFASSKPVSSPDCPVLVTSVLAAARTSRYHSTTLNVWDWLEFDPSLPLQWQMEMCLPIPRNHFSLEDTHQHHISCCLSLVCLAVWSVDLKTIGSACWPCWSRPLAYVVACVIFLSSS